MAFDLMTANAAKSRAMVLLMATPDTAFFGHIVFSLQFAWDESIRTASVDGITIRANPHYFLSLSPEERVALLVHEACHVAYLHMDRKMGRDHQKFNQAADYVINLALSLRGFRIPPSWLLNRKFVDMTTEQVYDILPTPPPDTVDVDIQLVDDPDGDLTRRIQDILCTAAIQSKLEDKPGTIPGDIQIFLDKLLKPKLPWNRILQKYLFALTKSDYSFKKFNRRFFPQHYLPSLFSQKVIDIAVAVDTSCSVSDSEFLRMITEIHSILKMMMPDKLTLIQFDTRIHTVRPIRNVRELMSTEFTGRGGTDIKEVIEWSNENKPQLLIIFTDGGLEFPEVKPTANWIWLVHNNPKFTAQFGKIIHYHP